MKFINKLLIPITSVFAVSTPLTMLTSCGGEKPISKECYIKTDAEWVDLDKSSYFTGEPLTITLTSNDSRYKVSGIIAVMVDKKSLSPTTYTFNKLNGQLTLPANIATGNIDITPKGALSVSFSDATWQQVISYADQGLETAKRAFDVETFIGLTRKLKINDDSKEKEVTVRVVGENHDLLDDNNGTDDENATFTFEIVDQLSDYDGAFGTNESPYWYNPDPVDVSCSIRQYFQVNMMDKIELDVRNHIKTVFKPTIAPNNSIRWDREKLFIPSMAELYSAKAIDNLYGKDLNKALWKAEGYQYDYYKQFETDQDPSKPRQGLIKNNQNYWLRTIAMQQSADNNWLSMIITGNQFEEIDAGSLISYEMIQNDPDIYPMFCI